MLGGVYPKLIAQARKRLTQRAWEETIHEYEQFVARIRFDCAELSEPLPAFLFLSKSATPRKKEKEDPLPPGFC
jgi:hypothetical protein